MFTTSPFHLYVIKISNETKRFPPATKKMMRFLSSIETNQVMNNGEIGTDKKAACHAHSELPKRLKLTRKVSIHEDKRPWYQRFHSLSQGNNIGHQHKTSHTIRQMRYCAIGFHCRTCMEADFPRKV
jgi:hypothetical protein